MKKIDIIIVLLVGAAIISTAMFIFLTLDYFEIRKHNFYVKKHQQPDECQLMLYGNDPHFGFKGRYAMRQFFHCAVSLDGNTDCFQKYRQEILTCLETTGQKMAESEIAYHLTGVVLPELCQDVEKGCLRIKNNNTEFSEDEKLIESVKNYCIYRFEKECLSFNAN